MRKFSFIILILIFSSFCFAQTETEISNKIAVIDTDAFFEESTGIIELIMAKKKLDEEFKPYNEEINRMTEDLNREKNEILKFAEFMKNNPNGIIGSFEPIAQRIDKYENSAKEIKEKVGNVKSLYEKREKEMFEIEFENVKKELLNFAKEKNYERIFDVSDNYEKFGLSSYKTVYESKNSVTEKLDITKDFIFYYNSAKKDD